MIKKDSISLFVIPFYNEFERICIKEYHKTFLLDESIDFVLVDDGSTDDTLTLLRQFEKDYPHVHLLINVRNSGKAEAIRTAILNFPLEKYRYIGYLDADLATPAEELIKMTSFIENTPQYNFIMGSRIKKMGSVITRYAYRHYFGRIFATIVSYFIIKTAVYDTQCGAKIIEKELATVLFQAPFHTRWLFDIELLLRYKKQNALFALNIFEFSLDTWTEKGKSKITLKDLIGFPFQLIKIYRKYV